MDLWMDVSQDDTGAINSVVVGCRAHNSRSVYTDIADAKYWTSQHHRDLHHNRDSVKVEQIGAPVQRARTAPMTERIVTLLTDTEDIGTQDVADGVGTSYQSAYTLLCRLAKAGQVTKLNAGRGTRWSLTDAA